MSTWTTKLPDRDGWYWLRHVIGSIPSDEPLHVITMRRTVKRRGKFVYRYDTRPSVYWRGKWRCITEVPTGYRWMWSSHPIRLPNRA